MKSINLINKEAQRALNLLNLRKKIRLVVIGGISFFALILVAVLLALLMVKGTYRRNQNKITALKEEIKTLEKTESYAVIIADRVKGINNILDQRKSYLKAIADIETLSVPDFKLEMLDITSKGDLKISGTCETRESIVDFNNRLEEISEQKRYSTVVYPLVNRTKDGRYNLILELKQ